MDNSDEKQVGRSGARYVYQPQTVHHEQRRHRNTSCCGRLCGCIFSPFGLCLILIAYGIIGAFIFRAIEMKENSGNVEDEVSSSEISKSPSVQTSALHEQLSRRMWNITVQFNVLHERNWTLKISKEILKFERKLISMLTNKVEIKQNKKTPSKEENWTFFRALLYSLTLVTTIGHGSITPHTMIGKILTVIYAVFGIPLMLLYLTRMGDLLARNFKTIYCAIFRRKSKPKCQNRTSGKDSYDEVQVQCPLAEHVNRGKIYTTDDVIPSERCRTSECFQERPNVASIHRPVQCVRLQQLPTLNEETERTTFKRNGDIVIGERHGGGALPVRHDDDDDHEGFKSKVTVPVFISLFIVLTYFFSGAALFHYLEGWSYMDSVFFCFTSLTTIGFGFMHPGKEDQSKLSSEVRIILCYIYLTLGMAIIAMCFNLMQECVMKNKKPAGYPDVTRNVDAPETGERLHAEPHQPDIYC